MNATRAVTQSLCHDGRDRDQRPRWATTTWVSGERAVFDRLERFYDAIPRHAARTEEFGGLVLFVREGRGWPFYARPRLDAPAPPSSADVEAVRGRQRQLEIPETFEWVDQTTPGFLATARACGLDVLEAPLLVLDADPRSIAPDPAVRLMRHDAATFPDDFAMAHAVAAVGFAAAGTARSDAGPSDRDAAVSPLDLEDVASARELAAAGARTTAVFEDDRGIVACGMVQRAGDVAELVGIATLPSARRQGLGGRITLTLAATALAAGADLVFLSAGSDEIARVYERVGFRRIGTACIAEAPM